MKPFRKGLIAVGFLAAMVSTVAYAAGLFSTLPIIGGASFCASTVTGTGGLGGITGQGQGSTGSICGQTVPAGPPSLTGAELFPADTGAGGNGGGAATAVVTTCQMGAGAYTLVSPWTGTTATIPNQTCYYYVGGTTTVTTLTLTMPSAPLDGQTVVLASTVAITTLSVIANTGQTIAAGGPTSAVANTSVGKWIYNASLKTWFRA